MKATRFTAIALLAASLPGLASAADLTLTIKDILTAEGTLRVGLYDANSYEAGDAVAGVNIEVGGTEATATVKGLAPGVYAIKLFHDVDNDGKMAVNPFGMPTEPFAFSNSAKGRFGPAKWDAAKFEVSESGTAHTISMN